MTKTLVDRQPTDRQELARQVRSHPFVDGPTRKLVRSWIQHDPPPSQIPRTPWSSRCVTAGWRWSPAPASPATTSPPSTRSWSAATPGGATRAGEPSRPATTEADVGIYHLHIDPRFGHQDLDCVLPLRRLQELCADGIVGEVAATHYSFMGYILQPPPTAGRHRPGDRRPHGRRSRGCGGAGAGVTDLLPVGRTGPASA
jgi:hypothetical protein